MLNIEASAHSKAERETVWELLADVTTWPRWAAFEEAELETAPGEGEVRRFRRGKWETREKVIEMEAPSRLRYELLSGIPIKDYVAEVRLEPAGDGGTDITWTSHFRAKIPGTGKIMELRLGDFVAETARALAAAAEKATTESAP